MLAGTGTAARSGASSRSGALDASSSSASGLPAVARCSRQAVSGGTSGIRLAAPALGSPPIRPRGPLRLPAAPLAAGPPADPECGQAGTVQQGRLAFTHRDQDGDGV